MIGDPVVLYEDGTYRITKVGVMLKELVLEVRRKDAVREPFWHQLDKVGLNNEYRSLEVPNSVLLNLLEFWKGGRKDCGLE
jgi:hypothetical protein